MAYKLFPFGIIPTIIGGNPATGFHVWSYEAGTTTPKATYTDSTGGSPNPNPVVLDQYGFKPIWLSDDSKYKLVFNSSDDSTNYLTLDNVEGITSVFSSSSSITLSEILDSIGNPILTFTNAANAVNGVSIIESATGISPTIKGIGTDSNVGLTLSTQGSGLASFGTTFGLTGALAPASISTNQNDYSPVGFASCNVLNLSSSTDVTITGYGGGSIGKAVYIYNAGANRITLSANDTNSLAANRFGFTSSITLGPTQGITVIYQSNGWCLINSGSLLQMIRTKSTSQVATTGVFSATPAVSEGAQIFSVSVTTTAPNSVVEVYVSCPSVSFNGTSSSPALVLFNNSTFLNYSILATGVAGCDIPVYFCHYFSPGAVGTYTISLRVGNLNGTSGGITVLGGLISNGIIIKEYAA